MYRSKDCQQQEFSDFYLPFSGHLDPENRWVALARLVPWELAEEPLCKQLGHAELCENSGQPIVPARVALGALLIKERLGLTDRETVETIQENPYLQFFLGKEEFSQDTPFDASPMVARHKNYGRNRIRARVGKRFRVTRQSRPTDRRCHVYSSSPLPSIWRYPTDISLLNKTWEKTDVIIGQLHAPLVGKTSRPRTYRRKARRAFVAFTKHKKPGRKKVRRAKRQQLAFLRRNFKAIGRLLEHPAALPLTQLARRDYKNLLVARELFRQQLEMFENKSQRVDDRIVSISQPHVRPIVRGKAGRLTEFGAKLSISVVQGFSFVERLSWDSYNEGGDLIGQIETFHRRFGSYPESVHVDNIYRKELARFIAHGPIGRFASSRAFA